MGELGRRSYVLGERRDSEERLDTVARYMSLVDVAGHINCEKIARTIFTRITNRTTTQQLILLGYPSVNNSYNGTILNKMYEMEGMNNRQKYHQNQTSFRWSKHSTGIVC